MKKILLIIFLFIPTIVLSYNDTLNPLCTLKEKAKLRNDFLNFNYVFEKYKQTDEILYKVTILNLNDDIVLEYNDTIYNKDKNIIEGIVPGTVVYLKVYAKPNSICDGFNISSKTLNIPYYNKFKDHELCVGNEEYFLCKENVNTKIDENTFISKINQYIKIKNIPVKPNDEVNVITEDKDNFEVFLNFLFEYYIYIFFSIITLGTIGIILLLEKKKKQLY